MANYTTGEMEQDLLALPGCFGADKATPIGHDTGANLAWTFAVHHPERVDKLVVLSLPHPTAYVQAITQDPQQRQSSSTSLALANPVPADRAAYQETFARTRPDALVAFFQANSSARAAAGTPLLPLVPVTVPTLVIHGLNDPFVLPASFATTCQYVQGTSALVMIPGAGHFVQRDAVETVNTLIGNWLRN